VCVLFSVWSAATSVVEEEEEEEEDEFEREKESILSD
jgi:hypothetical protein